MGHFLLSRWLAIVGSAALARGLPCQLLLGGTRDGLVGIVLARRVHERFGKAKHARPRAPVSTDAHERSAGPAEMVEQSSRDVEKGAK